PGAKTGITIEKPLRKGNAHSRSELKQKCGRRKHPQSIGPKQFSDRRMRRKIRPPFRSSEMAVWCPAPHSANSTSTQHTLRNEGSLEVVASLPVFTTGMCQSCNSLFESLFNSLSQ